MQIAQSGTPVNLSASGAVSLVSGSVLGYHVNSTSGGTLVIRNGGTSAGTALNAAVAPGVGVAVLVRYQPLRLVRLEAPPEEARLLPSFAHVGLQLVELFRD